LDVATHQADPETAATALADAHAALDRAAKAGAIHPNAAARRKSRLTRKVNAALGGTHVQTTGRVTKTTGKAAAAKAAKSRIALGKAGKAKGAQTAAGKARAALSKTARAEAAASAAADQAKAAGAPAIQVKAVKAPAKAKAKATRAKPAAKATATAKVKPPTRKPAAKKADA
ncbi:MAG: 30S ribosomal protein S20, partial [Chloroflexota bacterium]|nr:30S ribosomal protein S20 [Chloroflexota bacterium]